MDLKSTNHYFSHGEAPLEFLRTNKENPFVDSFSDPLCKLNLKETSEFVRSLPMANNVVAENRASSMEVSVQRRRGLSSNVGNRSSSIVEAPSTPGRPIFSFSVGNVSRKSFPSKWDDAEKWLINGGSCHEPSSSPVFHHQPLSKASKQSSGVRPIEKTEVFTETKPVFLDNRSSAMAVNGVPNAASADLVLKDKFTDEEQHIFPKFRSSEPTKQGFLFGHNDKSSKNTDIDVIHEVKHRDIGTDMTPLGSSTTSRCHTPLKNSSPARHNTPSDRSGPLASTYPAKGIIDISQLREFDFKIESQFDSLTSNWSSRQEEEEEVSKSLRHFEMNNEEEEETKCCLRYQREEARIQAWVNLQTAKAEAQSRKLEVKIEKMRSNLEEKIMKRMAIVHRRAEEWRATAQIRHADQIHKAKEEAKRKIVVLNRQNSRLSCGCFPCNKT